MNTTFLRTRRIGLFVQCYIAAIAVFLPLLLADAASAATPASGAASITRGMRTKWNAGASLDSSDAQNIVNNPGITLLELNSDWHALEPTPGYYQFAPIVTRLEEAKKYGLKVLLGIVTSAVSSPTWLKDGRAILGRVPKMVQLYSPRVGGPTVVPVFWDASEPYQSRLKAFLYALSNYPIDSYGTPLRNHPALAEIKVGVLSLDWDEELIVANPNDGYSKANAIAAGYTPEIAAFSAKDLVWNAGRDFPKQIIRVSYHRNVIDKDAPFNQGVTWQAERLLGWAENYTD